VALAFSSPSNVGMFLVAEALAKVASPSSFLVVVVDDDILTGWMMLMCLSL